MEVGAAVALAQVLSVSVQARAVRGAARTGSGRAAGEGMGSREVLLLWLALQCHTTRWQVLLISTMQQQDQGCLRPHQQR